MASNSPAAKLGNVSVSTGPPVASQPSPSSGADNASRRGGGSGSFGAGASTRGAGSQPRKQQGSKNQHKHSRRYRLADEDAIAESVRAIKEFKKSLSDTDPFIERHAILHEQEGPDVHYSSHELFSSTTAQQLLPPKLSKKQQPKPKMGHGVRVPCD